MTNLKEMKWERYPNSQGLCDMIYCLKTAFWQAVTSTDTEIGRVIPKINLCDKCHDKVIGAK